MNTPIKVIAFSVFYPVYWIRYKSLKKEFPIVESATTTLEFLINNRKSFSRFGDGELNLINGCGIGFQDADTRLGNELKRVLISEDDNCKIGLPNIFNGMTQMRFDAKCFWLYKVVMNWKKWKRIIPQKVYLDSLTSRFFMDSNSREQSIKIFSLWKKLWENRKVVIVEGEFSKLGVGNDMFENAKNVRRIICPSNNAFAKYDKILNCVNKQEKECLILIALGPTASILAFDLSRLGYQAVDIGHLDLEYEWMKVGVHKKSVVKGRAVNELSMVGVEVIEDVNYHNQIIQRIF